MVEFQKPRFLIKFLAAVVRGALGTLGMPEKNEAASGPSGGSEEARAASLGSDALVREFLTLDV
jgi:hypothetical protein